MSALQGVRRWVAIAVCAAAATGALAGGRTVYVDLDKVFDEFYKTKLADAQLKEQADQYREERTKMVDDFNKQQDEFRIARDQAQDTALSEEARNARRAIAEEKLVELREAEGRIRRFEESRRRQLDEQTRRVRTKLVDEIKETVSGYAKAQGFAAVIDASGENLNGVPTILYYDPRADITAALIELLNTGRAAGGT